MYMHKIPYSHPRMHTQVCLHTSGTHRACLPKVMRECTNNTPTPHDSTHPLTHHRLPYIGISACMPGVASTNLLTCACATHVHSSTFVSTCIHTHISIVYPTPHQKSTHNHICTFMSFSLPSPQQFRASTEQCQDVCSAFDRVLGCGPHVFPNHKMP